MPKLRMTEREQREMALKLAMARGKVELGLENNAELMEFLGMPRTTFYAKNNDPYKGFGFAEAAELARKLHFTDRELCAIFGVPYRAGRDESCA